ncbi:hypothetical protein Q8F55_001345 [Vanrija albida]|uniref:VPS9 domain-containing protein n=1 Tax=Vanrija albida TaxID=181172 RepID=A0ABR3QFT7_9TREE
MAESTAAHAPVDAATPTAPEAPEQPEAQASTAAQASSSSSPVQVVDLTSPPRAVPSPPPAPTPAPPAPSISTDAGSESSSQAHVVSLSSPDTNGHEGEQATADDHDDEPSSPTPPAASSPSKLPASPSKRTLPPLAMAESPPRRSSLHHLAPRRPALSLVTPGAGTPAARSAGGASTLTPPPAPAKAPPGALRAAADVAEFDPFATPVPGPAREEATPTQARASRTATPETPASRRRIVRAESGDAETASTSDEPVFNFAGFLKDLRSRPADPIARYLKSFLTNFAKKPFTINEQIKLVRDFLSFIAEKMSTVEPWKSQSPAEFDNALEAMEKLVMNRLYPFTFTPQLTNGQTITTDDLERDAVFEQRVRLFSWVRGYHLDVPENEATQGFLGFAEQELLKINHYKAPRDKMICILNCCKVIFGLIRHTAGSDATSADAFVPILIFVVLRAAPENMLSNIEYISRFRNAEKLQGEAGYYLSSLQGAIQFIETMDASSLSNITQEEFESNVEKAIQELPSSPSSPRARSSIPTNNDVSPWATTPGEEPARQLALPATAAALDGTKRFFQRTGDAAKEAVSRPLNTISKILQDMQQQATQESGSESGDDDTVDRWAPGGPRDRQHEHRAHNPHGSMPVAVPSPQHIHGRGEPAPPSHLLAQLGISPGDPTPSGTPREPTPDYAAQMHHTLEASHEEYAREQARAANVMTLHQMFPALDEEIVDAVLYSCGDDLGHAIDRLLEM